jgi:hypothetical protein
MPVSAMPFGTQEKPKPCRSIEKPFSARKLQAENETIGYLDCCQKFILSDAAFYPALSRKFPGNTERKG